MIAVVPIRSGSKGLQNKNVLNLNGKPLVGYTIEALLNSRKINSSNIYVSTDSTDYINLLKRYYPNIHYHLRSFQLASDTSTTADFLKVFLKTFSNSQDFILCQATSPLRDGVEIDKAVSLFYKNHLRNVVSIKKSQEHENLYTNIDSDARLLDIVGIDQGYNRQKSAQRFLPNGAIYLSNIGKYLHDPSFFKDDTIGYLMNELKSIDIDNIESFKIAESLLSSEDKLPSISSIDCLGNLYLNAHNKNILISDGSIPDLTSYFPNDYFELNAFSKKISINMILKLLDGGFLSKCSSLVISSGLTDLRENEYSTITTQLRELFNVCSKLKIKLIFCQVEGPKYDYHYSYADILRLNNFVKLLASESKQTFFPII